MRNIDTNNLKQHVCIHQEMSFKGILRLSFNIYGKSPAFFEECTINCTCLKIHLESFFLLFDIQEKQNK